MKPKQFSADTSCMAVPEPMSDFSCSLGQFPLSLHCDVDLMSTTHLPHSPAGTSLIADCRMDLRTKLLSLGASTAWGQPSGDEEFLP